MPDLDLNITPTFPTDAESAGDTDNVFRELATRMQAQLARYREGTFANRPAASPATRGRRYLVNSGPGVGTEYLDLGTDWAEAYAPPISALVISRVQNVQVPDGGAVRPHEEVSHNRGGMYSASAPDRLTIVKDGLYTLSANVYYLGSPTGITDLRCTLVVSMSNGQTRHQAQSDGQGDRRGTALAAAELFAGDYVRLTVGSLTQTTTPSYSQIAVHRLSA